MNNNGMLMPCPFCNSSSVRHVFLPTMSRGAARTYTIQCANCCATGPRGPKDVATDKWNKRPAVKS